MNIKAEKHQLRTLAYLLCALKWITCTFWEYILLLWMVQSMVAKKCYTPSRWWLTLQYFWKDNTSKQLLKPFLAVAMRVLYDRGIKQSIQRWESDLLWHTVHPECFFFCSKIILSAQHSCNLWKKMTDTDFQFDRAVDHFHQSVRFFCVNIQHSYTAIWKLWLLHIK